jgi:hypothetical protein
MSEIYFDQTERKIINENNSLYANRMRIHIVTHNFKKQLMKTFIGKILLRLLK